jgi:hypothetical protein
MENGETWFCNNGPIIINVLVTVENQFIPISGGRGGARVMGSEETGNTHGNSVAKFPLIT